MAEVTKPIKVGNVWTNLISGTTGESVNFEEVTTWWDGTPMDDSKVDGIIYRKLPISAGGGYVKRCWSGAFKMKWAGVKGDGVTDNTSIYTAVISALEPNTYIEWEPNGTYVGSFVSNKPFTLNFNNSILVNPNNTSSIIRIEGDVDFTFGEVTSPTSYGDSYFETDEAGLLSPEDIVFIYDSKVRPADSAAMINTELLKVREIDGNRVYVYDIIRSDQNAGIITLGKVSPIKDVSIINANIDCNSLNSSQVVFLQGIENLNINNINVNESSLMAVSIRYSYNTDIQNIVVRNAQSIDTGGRGYGVHHLHSRNISVNRIEGLGTRHVVDNNSCYSGKISNIKASGGNLGQVVVAHNSFGGNFEVSDILQEGGSGCVGVSDQGLLDAPAKVNHIFHDLVVSNVKHIIPYERWATASDQTIRTVFIGGSTSNVVIDNINTQLVGDIDSFTMDADAHCSVRVYGVPIGPTIFNNIFCNKIGTAIRFLSNVVTPANMPAHEELIINNLSIKNCIYGLWAGGCKSVTTTNVIYTGDAAELPILFNLTQLDNTPHTTSLKVYNLISGGAQILQTAASYDDSLLEGGIYHQSNTTEISVTGSTSLSLTDILLHKKIILVNDTGSALNLSNTILPLPKFANQELEIYIPNSNPNNISWGISSLNLQYGRYATRRLANGNTYKLKSVNTGSTNIWEVESISSLISDGLIYNSSTDTLSGLPNAGGSIVPSTAPNGTGFTFNGPNAASTFVMTFNYTAERLRLLTFNSNSTLKSQADILTSDIVATTTNKGGVFQAEASSDTAAAVGATYSQAEVQAILTELRDLKTKMRAAGLLAT